MSGLTPLFKDKLIQKNFINSLKPAVPGSHKKKAPSVNFSVFSAISNLVRKIPCHSAVCERDLQSYKNSEPPLISKCDFKT